MFDSRSWLSSLSGNMAYKETLEVDFAALDNETRRKLHHALYRQECRAWLLRNKMTAVDSVPIYGKCDHFTRHW